MIDIEILDGPRKFPETVNAFANSSGGRIICEGFEPVMPPAIPFIIESDGSIYVPPLAWHKKPALLNGRVYRRIEGENVISGLWARSMIASDAHEFSRDDFPVENVELNQRAVNEFGGDLRRFGAYSGRFLTFAGALMFGDILKIKAEAPSQHAEIEASNIWFAYTEILPRLTSVLSSRCSQALTEIFINALIHSDYNIDRIISITILPNPARIIVNNPGTIKLTIRNHRLKKMFDILSPKNFHGLNIIKNYEPNFELEEDMLRLRTVSTLKLEGRKELPAPIIL